MPAIFLYLLKLSATLAIIWLFYYVVLRPLTFHSLNRWYLLGYSLLAFAIPLIDIAPIITSGDTVSGSAYITLIPAMGNYTPVVTAHLAPHPATTVDPWGLTLLLLAAGMVLLLTRTAIRWASLARIRRQATLISDDPAVRIYQVNRPITPFSFGRSIYINPRLHTETEWAEIIQHEYVHIRQRHTVDILLGELLTVTNWYNPFAWLIRHAIRQNLEFIADQQVLDKGFDKKDYQYHLLKAVGHPAYRLANNFNFSSLKKRIIMMNKMRTTRLHLLKLLFLLPLMAVVLLAFRSSYPGLLHRKGDKVYMNAVGIVLLLPAKTPLAGVTVRETVTGMQTTTDQRGYYKLRIPVNADSGHIHFDYLKEGYEPGMAGRSWTRPITADFGAIQLAFVVDTTIKNQELFFAAPSFKKAPADPGYDDAYADCQRVLTDNQQLKHQKDIEKAHPEISHFYLTEDHQRRIVFHKDGSIERYGYPGTPSLAEMDKRYGILPWSGPEGANTNAGYLARWAAIAEQAEKDFHPTGGNAKTIVFPGDSRVVVVDASGKTRLYDMDSNAPEERAAFEQTYGPLPNCVPKPGAAPATSRVSPAKASADTTPRPINGVVFTDKASNGADLKKANVIIDGVQSTRESMNALKPEDIESMDILTPDQSFKFFGDKGRYGTIAIMTRAYAAKTPPPPAVKNYGLQRADPVIVVDGTRLPEGMKILSLINPDKIESIQVLKDSTAASQYGAEAAKNGVVLIKTKPTNAPSNGTIRIQTKPGPDSHP